MSEVIEFTHEGDDGNEYEERVYRHRREEEAERRLGY